MNPILRKIFPRDLQEKSLKAGKLKYFLQNCQVLTSDQAILEIFRRKLPIQGRSHQVREPREVSMSQCEQNAVNKEIQSMLKKRCLKRGTTSSRSISVNKVCESKKGENKFRLIINLKQLNQHMPYLHFKMEGMKNVTDLLNAGDYMLKIDLFS